MRLSLAGLSGIEAALAKVNALMVRLAEPLPVRLAGFGGRDTQTSCHAPLAYATWPDAVSSFRI